MAIGRGKGRAAPLLTLLLAIALVPASTAFAYFQREQGLARLEHRLTEAARGEVAALSNYFERSRSIMLLTAHNPAFSGFYEAPGTRLEKVRAQDVAVVQTNEALAYLQSLFQDSIGEACFISVKGPENSRVVRGTYASPEELAPDESANPFFSPTFELDQEQVFQAAPYVSPDTGEWVISNSAIVPTEGGAKRAIVHFEVTVESFRQTAAARSQGLDVYVVDANSGAVVLDSRHPQEIGAPLGDEDDDRFAGLEGTGLTTVDGKPTAYRELPATAGNANRWVVVTMPSSAIGLVSVIGLGPLILIGLTLALLMVGIVFFRSSQRELTTAATTDGLTGLGNRRVLMSDLDRAVASARDGKGFTLTMFDLDGFKVYNDSYGHPAGDVLLRRLAQKLQQAVGSEGTAYRMGGDEFCLITFPAGDGDDATIEAAALALSERGEGFSIGCSYGTCAVPDEAIESTAILRLADVRMYERKLSGRVSPERQSRDVLLRVLHERYPELQVHLDTVARLAEELSRRLGLDEDKVATIRRAAELHDVGKVAVPDAILRKPGPLDAEEWNFMRRHPRIGERILNAAPSLARVAALVAAHHERYDGGGYPTGMSGEEIPLGARILAVCDAFHAMTSDDQHSGALSNEEALAELRRCAGTQFDPAVVEVFAMIDAAALIREQEEQDRTKVLLDG